VCLEQGRRRVGALEQHARLIVDAEVRGSDHPFHAPGKQPLSSGIQQRPGNLEIFHHFEEAEATHTILEVLEPQMVHKDRHCSERLAAAAGPQQPDIGVVEEGIGFGIQAVQAFRDERRHPVLIAAVYPPWEAHEVEQVPATGDLFDADWSAHGTVLSEPGGRGKQIRFYSA